MWLVDPTLRPDDDSVWVEVTDSQSKFMPSDDFQYVFELVRWSAPSGPSNLGKQIIHVRPNASGFCKR